MGVATLLCIVLAATGAAVMGAAVIRSRGLAPDIGEFMDPLGPEDREERLAEPVVTRLAGIVGRWASGRLERLVPANYLDKIGVQLLQAGLAGKRKPGQQLAVQIAGGAAGLALVPLLPDTSPMKELAALVLLPVMGFMLPGARLKRAVRARSDAIFQDLPDIVDMLAIAVEAGSGFESAINVVCKNFASPFADELSMALKEMELGLPRREALQRLRDRVDLDAVRVLVLSLLQADALGIPIGRVLKTQATEMRARRRAWARERAAKLPVKILFPLVLFIFPPIMALVLGPAATSFGKING